MNDASLVYSVVKNKIGMLNGQDAWSKAALAKLRKGAGKDITESLESWELVFSDLPEQLKGTDSKVGFHPSEAERAIHTALTTYAVHMQSKSQSMSIEGRSFAVGARILMLKQDSEGVKRRFDSMITASDVTEFAYHARSMVQMMRQEDLGFDYPEFARDLYYLQLPNGSRNILIKWGEDFYTKAKEENENEE